MKPISETITSRQNPKVKNLLHLQKFRERNRQDLFVVEGIREIEKALQANYPVEQVYFHPGLISYEQLTILFGGSLPEQLFQVSSEVYDKIAYRENSGGVVAVFHPKQQTVETLSLSKNPLILVIEGIEKSGNMGALYRTADAAGVDAILLCGSATDPYNPNAIRASLGCVFTVQTVILSVQEAIRWLKEQKIEIYCTYLQAAVTYHTVNFRGPSAIVMGTEATGISEQWLRESTSNIIIPMRGVVDSLNVSTSAAIVIFEACRQRNFSE